MKTKIIKSKSAQETLMIGEKIASELKGNEIILLFGELGSGKTTLSQGLIKGGYMNPQGSVKRDDPIPDFDLWNFEKGGKVKK